MELEPTDRKRPAPADPPAGWSPRTRRLIGEVRTLCRQWLSEPLKLCLNDFDRALHQRSVSTRSHVDQQRYLATRQRLVLARQAFEERFIARVDRALLDLGTSPAVAAGPAPRLTLSLLDPLEHELTAAIDQLVARSEARGGPLLVELSYRFAVLVGQPPLENEAMPLGPQAMAKAFREASTALGLPVEHHLLLLQSLEGRLIEGLAPLYELVNRYLALDGILPQLRPFPLPRAAVRAPRAAPPPASAPAPAATPAPTSSKAPAAASAPPHPAASGDLRTLLAHQRTQRPVVAEADVAGGGALQEALATLQQRLRRSGDGEALLTDSGRLRRAIVDQLNLGLPLDAPRRLLSPAQGDTLELIVRLFRALHAELAPTDALHDMLDVLELPVLRAALADPQFFESPTQPARRLLNRLLATARDWLDGTPTEADRALRGQLERHAEQFAAQPIDPALAGRLLADLDQHLGQQQRKAQLAERRHVESLQGRERLEQAREHARELIATRFAQHPPSGLLRTLFERAWSDVLALTLLRNGEESEAFARRLVVTDQLLGRLPHGDRRKLQMEVEAALQQIGIQGDEAVQVARRLMGVTGEGEPASAGLASLAARLKQRPGEPAGADGAVRRGPSTTAELRLHQRLSARRTGWYEFSVPGNGTVRRKLAWYSPRSGRSLFVTRHGARAEELSLAEFTERVTGGQVREMPALRINLLERAWRNVVADLSGTPEKR